MVILDNLSRVIIIVLQIHVTIKKIWTQNGNIQREIYLKKIIKLVTK